MIARFWPKSLRGQMLLAIALALLLAQGFSAVLLYRAQHERREAALVHLTAMRLFTATREFPPEVLPGGDNGPAPDHGPMRGPNHGRPHGPPPPELFVPPVFVPETTRNRPVSVSRSWPLRYSPRVQLPDDSVAKVKT